MKQGLNNINVYNQNALCGETVPLSATTSSSSVTFALSYSAVNPDVLVTNAGSVTAFLAFGVAANGAVTAQLPGTSGTLNATPILAGETITFQKNYGGNLSDTCAAITASGSAQLYFTSIQGS